MAAFSASSAGEAGSADVTVLERNEKAGKKLYITGKGRCNFTNVCSVPELLAHVVTNPRFMYSAFSSLTPEETLRFFEESGCPVKVERGRRAFPVSDHASDITRALLRRCEKCGVSFRYGTSVRGLRTEGDHVSGIELEDGSLLAADAVILATGGRAYPSTGSTGDGYRIAEELGHHILPQEPSLVPFTVADPWAAQLQGLTLRNVTLTMRVTGRKKAVFSDFGELLFTHFGVSGPLVLSASAHYHRGMEAKLFIDLKPALTEEQLDARLVSELESNRGKTFRNAISTLFPARLTPIMASLSGIPETTRASCVDRGSRRAFVHLIKELPLAVTGTRGFEEAVITRGGVDVREIDPSTMASKLVGGLYLAGEILDVDALTGGYNLQIAWSTGYLAGRSAASVMRQDPLTMGSHTG